MCINIVYISKNIAVPCLVPWVCLDLYSEKTLAGMNDSVYGIVELTLINTDVIQNTHTALINTVYFSWNHTKKFIYEQLLRQEHLLNLSS